MEVPTPLVTCPYDETHRIRKSALSFHMAKCRQNHPDSTKKICPFNAVHLVDDVCYEAHLLACPSNSFKIEQYKFEHEDQKYGLVPLEAVLNSSPPVMQDWVEEEYPTYDPWKGTENKRVIRMLTCVSKAKKKRFRLRERQRFQSIDSGIPKSRRHTLDTSQLVEQMRKLIIQDLDDLFSKLIISDSHIKKEEAVSSVVLGIKNLIISESRKLKLNKRSPGIESVLVDKLKLLVFLKEEE